MSEPPGISTTAKARADGTIISLDLLLRTRRSEYFALSYWSEGLRVRGFLGRPLNDAKHPVVVFNRGGNREFGALEGWEIVPFVEAGYVAVASQYRGNGGGEGWDEFGGADVADVLNLIPLLASVPEADADRVGMVGVSRGGMMTYLALAHQARRGAGWIKCAVTIGGVADLEDSLVKRPELLDLVYLPLIGASPQEAPQAYRDRSAVEWPELLTVPLLLLHGEADLQVPVRQSRRLAGRAQAMGRPVRLITFPGDDHGLSTHRHGLPETLWWLGLHLGRGGEDHTYERHLAEVSETMGLWPR